jgi:AraC-like DNA-binding protein
VVLIQYMQFLPWSCAELPQIAAAGRFPHFDQNHERKYQCPTHALHLYDYAATMILGGDTLELEPGDITLSPAGLCSSYAMQRPGVHLCVHFWPATKRDTHDVGCQIPVHVRLGLQREGVRARLLEIVHYDAQSETNPILLARANALLLELMLRLASTESPVDKVRRRSEFAVEAAASWLDAHPAERLDVPVLARRVGLSQNHLAHRFRDRFGRTLQTYFLEHRIALARQMLLATELSIKEVAACVGISDAQYFNKQFRRFSGESPSVCRNRLRATIRTPQRIETWRKANRAMS